jgi:GT2 family glycosyltransferase
MQLSIIIVNYNVKYFLEQCLHSVYNATKNISAEVFVVDNNSVDGSCAMVKEKFPQVQLIENHENTGFSVANNQAMRIARGKYFLLLNPDTVVQEDTFDNVLAFMEEHPDAGGLGIKMIDGKGQFLPESKRGLPTPEVSFYKIFGLSKLFPKSKRFSKYHLGYLSNDEVHEIEVLAGAFMLMRKETLDNVGLLDEDYFMYGEDIDLSYRITKGGYKNYYYPHSPIIHYKGESTKKGSINYVKVFYNAMIIFAKKHFSEKNARLFSFFINLAIYFRALLAITSRLAKRMAVPFIDAVLLFLGFFLIAPLWEPVKYQDGGHFPQSYFLLVVPSYIAIWLLSILFSGGYDKPFKITKISRGLIVGSGVILIVYALLPEAYRFSRAMILWGTLFGLITTALTRLAFHILKFSDFRIDFGKKKSVAVVGTPEEKDRVLGIIQQAVTNLEFAGLVQPNNQKHGDEYMGNLSQLEEIISINKIDEIIFCAENIKSQEIISNMLLLENAGVSFKIAPPESMSIIGSNSIDTAGDLYALDFNTITKPTNIRSKRVFDIISSMAFLALFPILIAFVKKPFSFLGNIFLVLLGMRTWVGFYLGTGQNIIQLPKLKKGVISWALVKMPEGLAEDKAQNINLIYAKNYNLYNDFKILLKGIKFLGRT